ncbi:vacuolar-type H+-ATPase subunit I/STV1 [Streptococcus rupicaprae]|uniref:Vacuolar-type H+-ATPase subunit I/STV1 n=1 Tax=Streptococcus rupicaprae TaxID=759619 RepID=A0ABV2FJI0_9STRE
MNELTLPNNLAQIELEINHHKQIAGQSIWEIGRRLNHVKEHDLAHGQFGQWLEHIGIQYREANRMMTVAKKLPNVTTLSDFGSTTLYLIATLPDEDKAEQLKRIEQGDSPTVRELQEVKRKLKLKDQANELLKQENMTLKQKGVQYKEIIKEVVPADYNEAINLSQELMESNKAHAERNAFLEKQIKDLYDKRAEVDEKSARYDELTEAIRQSEGRLNEAQAKIGDYNHMLTYLRKGNELLTSLGGITLVSERKWLKTDARLKNEFEMLADGLNYLTQQVNKMLKENDAEIIEGDIL